MYPGKHAAAQPTRPAVIMAVSGETVTYEGPHDANTRYWVTESGALEESWALPFTD